MAAGMTVGALLPRSTQPRHVICYLKKYRAQCILEAATRASRALAAVVMCRGSFWICRQTARFVQLTGGGRMK